MSTTCDIIFDHSDGVYNSGEVLNGNIKLETVKVKSIRGISINIIGYGKVYWSESDGEDSTSHRAYEEFINYITYVVGSAKGNNFILNPGVYNYSFSYPLPKDLPTSLNEPMSIGKIKYKVIVTIDRRLRFDNAFKRYFNVNHILDLNIDPENKLPRRINNKKNIYSLFGYGSASISGDLEIPKSGYVPGEDISFKLKIFNDTSMKLSAPKIKLKKYSTFTCTFPLTKHKKILQDIEIHVLDPIPCQSHAEFKGIIHLPDLIPTQATKYFQLEYTLKANISLWRLCLNKFCIEIPITIGTIPIDGGLPNQTNVNNSLTGIIEINNEYGSSNTSILNSSGKPDDNLNDVTTINSPSGLVKHTSSYGWIDF